MGENIALEHDYVFPVWFLPHCSWYVVQFSAWVSYEPPLDLLRLPESVSVSFHLKALVQSVFCAFVCQLNAILPSESRSSSAISNEMFVLM